MKTISGIMMQRTLLLFTVVYFNFAQELSAQPGTPDYSFGTGSFTHTNINNANQLPLRPQTMASLDGNKIVVAGIADNLHCNITQFLANGHVDSSFGKDGIVYIKNFKAADIAVQTDGKLLICGNNAVGDGIEKMVLIRLHPDGRYDKGWLNTGRAEFSISSGNNALLALAIQPDGKIVAAGYAQTNGNYDFAAVRLLSNGSFDNSFDGDGKLVTAIGTINDFASAVCIQADGKIVLGGSAGVGSYWEFGVARYTSTGAPDNDFNGTGKLILSMSSTHDEINAMALQQDQKIVLGGYAHNGSNIDFALARLNTNGTPDNGFDGDGKLIVPIGSGDDNLRKVKVQSDGKIVAFGYTAGANYDYAILRFTPGGAPDTDFDTDGKAFANFNNYQDICMAGIIQSDNKIVAAGYSFLGTISDISVCRFTATGAPDNDFNGTGKQTLHQGSSTDYVFGMAAQPDGKLVVGGSTYIANSNYRDAALVRYNADGSIDGNFGNAGKVITAIGANEDMIHAVAVQPDGKIVVVGYLFQNGYRDMFVARYNTNGTPDTDFNGDGKRILNISATSDEAFAVLIQPDNKILIGGYAAEGSDRGFALVRLMPNGSFDNSFDTDGIVLTQFGAGTDKVNSLALNADGTIVAAGTAVVESDDFAIARYTSTGALDNSFNGNGKLVISIASFNNDRGEYITIQPDGKMVMVGASYVGFTFDFAIVRINPNGTLDNSFSDDGKLAIDIGLAYGTYDGATGVAIQHDGKIVVSGISSVENTWQLYYTVLRLNTNGTIDNSFGTNGITKINDITAVNNSTDAIARNIVLTDNRVIIAGTTNMVSDDFAIMALQVNNAPQSAAIYRFTGDGNFSTASNWQNSQLPPNPLPAGAEVIIDPAGNGQCTLDINYQLSPGAKLTVVAGKRFVVPGNLNLQ